MTDRSTLAPAFRAAAEAAVACRPTGLAVMRIDGDDATAFLQGQLSSDIAALAPGKAQWSSYNSPKGRMLASLRVWRDPDGAFGALVAADLAASIVKRLSMFVLRANVRVAARTSASTQAVGGPAAGAAIEARLRCAALPDGAVAAADRRATVVGLDDRRFVVVADAPDDDAVAHDLARAATPSPDAIWRWLAVEAGVPTITAATSDQFVPQMLNWDAIGGVNFQKGCYPGQEIVARMRYLGRLKERLYAFHLDTDPEPET